MQSILVNKRITKDKNKGYGHVKWLHGCITTNFITIQSRMDL